MQANASLAALSTCFARGGIVHRATERRATQATLAQLDTRLASLEQAIDTLSGGNQQKVLVGRWLLRETHILLLDEPTRGIDVAARRRMYQLFETLAGAGASILIASSDWDEIEATCDRVVVLAQGRMSGIWDRSAWSKRLVTQASFATWHDAPGAEASQRRVSG